MRNPLWLRFLLWLFNLNQVEIALEVDRGRISVEIIERQLEPLARTLEDRNPNLDLMTFWPGIRRSTFLSTSEVIIWISGMFTEPFINCRGRSACATPIQVRDRACTISAIDSRRRLCCSGIAPVKMSSVDYQYCLPTWDMSM